MAHVGDLPYDYRTIPSRGRYEFNHHHGQTSAALYDERGHLGVVDGCDGLVVHRAPLGVVYPDDTILPEDDELFVETDDADADDSGDVVIEEEDVPEIEEEKAADEASGEANNDEDT